MSWTTCACGSGRSLRTRFVGTPLVFGVLSRDAAAVRHAATARVADSARPANIAFSVRGRRVWWLAVPWVVEAVLRCSVWLCRREVACGRWLPRPCTLIVAASCRGSAACCSSVCIAWHSVFASQCVAWCRPGGSVIRVVLCAFDRACLTSPLGVLHCRVAGNGS